METYIAYFDETGDDGHNTLSSSHFVLTSVYMPAALWQQNYNSYKDIRRQLRNDYGFHVSEEMHTKYFLSDKNPYRAYNWNAEDRKEILKRFIIGISTLNFKAVNVIIDKTRFTDDGYPVLENALKYNIQRIENDCSGKWNYIIIADKGRIVPMRKTARSIRAFNPIQSQYQGFINRPIEGHIEDILEKDSKESCFIQIADFISYFIHLYYLAEYEHEDFPNRVANVINIKFVRKALSVLKEADKLNLKANERNEFGVVIYPK